MSLELCQTYLTPFDPIIRLHPVSMQGGGGGASGSSIATSKQQRAADTKAANAAADEKAAGVRGSIGALSKASSTQRKTAANACARATEAMQAAVDADGSVKNQRNAMLAAEAQAFAAGEALKAAVAEMRLIYTTAYREAQPQRELKTFSDIAEQITNFSGKWAQQCQQWTLQRKIKMDNLDQRAPAVLQGYTSPDAKDPKLPYKDVVRFYDKILPAYSKLTEWERTLFSCADDTFAAFKNLREFLEGYPFMYVLPVSPGDKLYYKNEKCLKDIKACLKAIEDCLSPHQKLRDALDPGVTAAVVEERLADIVNCTSVKTALPCCATCGRQPLPDIHLRGSKRVDHGMLHDVPLESVAAQFPWLRLTRGRCAACAAVGHAAGADSEPCGCRFVQRSDKSLDVAWPPPEPEGEESPQGAPAVYAEDVPHPLGDDHSGSDTGWYLGIPPMFRGAFPVSTDKPGFYVFVEPKYIKAEGGAELVPMCHGCYSSSGSSKAPAHSYANFRMGDPTHCDAALAELKTLTFIEKVTNRWKVEGGRVT